MLLAFINGTLYQYQSSQILETLPLRDVTADIYQVTILIQEFSAGYVSTRGWCQMGREEPPPAPVSAFLCTVLETSRAGPCWSGASQATAEHLCTLLGSVTKNCCTSSCHQEGQNLSHCLSSQSMARRVTHFC
ncbi:hypothetical protein AV530_006619 [Patagioenas fasciata monilis]|uniref:Uncharacterized protein n=1 Tax=Patagioenas fasciata monilis TaxID=372326 RepID=A0A1V4KH84_PATFA|nr:hypothetical protein AV530_006619 [Patagioenas fasciata monilis]